MDPWSQSKANWWHLKVPIISSTFGKISGSITKSACLFALIYNAVYAQIYQMMRRENFQQRAVVNTSLEIESETLFMKLSLPLFFDFVNP